MYVCMYVCTGVQSGRPSLPENVRQYGGDGVGRRDGHGHVAHLGATLHHVTRAQHEGRAEPYIHIHTYTYTYIQTIILKKTNVHIHT